MPIVNILGQDQKVKFPDDMTPELMRDFLRRKFSEESMRFTPPDLTPAGATMEAYIPSLRERMSKGVSDALYDSGAISDRYRAQNVGDNLTSLAEFVPGVGDVVDADEFGRAAASGDVGGMAMAGLGVIPVVGDAAQGAARKVFHGSDRRIDEYLRGSNKKGRLGAGIYFGDEKKAKLFVRLAEIKGKSGFLNKAEIISDNPKKVTEDMLLQYPQGGFPSEVFEAAGYTGIQLIDENTGRILEETVFDPAQVKSLNDPI